MSNMNEIPTIESSAVSPAVSETQPAEMLLPKEPAEEREKDPEKKPDEKTSGEGDATVVSTEGISVKPLSFLGFQMLKDQKKDERIKTLSDKASGVQIPSVAA